MHTEYNIMRVVCAWCCYCWSAH